MRIQEADAKGSILPDGSHADVHGEAFAVAKKRLAEEDAKEARNAEFKALLNGSDLKQAGVSEGPEIGEALRSARAAWEDGEFATREQALSWLRGYVGGQRNG